MCRTEHIIMLIRLNNISSKTDKKEIRTLFEPFGRVKSIIKSSRHYYVRMPHLHSAKLAIKKLDGMRWKGHTLEVKRAQLNNQNPVCLTQIGALRLL